MNISLCVLKHFACYDSFFFLQFIICLIFRHDNKITISDCEQIERKTKQHKYKVNKNLSEGIRNVPKGQIFAKRVEHHSFNVHSSHHFTFLSKLR